MKIGILHLTDIHFTEKTRLDSKMNSFCRALINDLSDIKKVYVIISGDIAFSGKKEEYEQAKKFLSVSKTLITSELKNLEFKYIVVPGNHDCNIAKYDNQLRKNILMNINYQTIGTDNSVIDLCLNVQTDFWDFYKNYNKTPDNKLFYTIEDIVEDRKICFHCMNTAWMSQKDEVVGGLFFPVKKFQTIKHEENSLNFGVWHHPYNWFNPNTSENNKTEFEKFTEDISSASFFGHEHVQSSYTNENRNSGRKINLFSGEVFNEDKKTNISGFQTLIIDLNTEVGEIKKYNWDKTYYDSSETYEIEFFKSVAENFKIKDEFINYLQEVKIPLVFDSKKETKLSEIFVFPDIDSTIRDTTTFENYSNSIKLLEKDFHHCIIDGESQVGKTSLLSMLFIKLYEKGIYPIMLLGKDFKDPNIEKIIKRAFKSQYENADKEFEKYLQLDKNKKAILFDDYQDCNFNTTTTQNVFKDLNQKFGKVITIFDSANSILASLKNQFKEAKYYTIKPFGYKKRNELIEKYHFLKQNQHTIDEHVFLNEVKATFDNVQSILGDKLMPPYPIYILSIIQALQYKPLKQNETSFGYCYQTLIHFSLHKSGVTNEDLDSYFNFLSELAYKFIVSQSDTITNHEMTKFYVEYSEKFLCPSYDVLLTTLKKSKIIQSEDQNFKFCYNYILYYLSAKKISEILHTDEGKQLLLELFNNMHEEQNANILVFITHHSKDISFIEQSLLNTMIVLENTTPITLEKNDPFYNEISTFVEKLKNDILEINRNPRLERDKQLLKQDQISREIVSDENEKLEHDDEDLKKSMLPFLQSFRSIEIVGQIIKNRKGSLEKKHLTEMLTELYTTGFRTIGYYSELLTSVKTEIIEMINEKLNSGDGKKEIEERINDFIQMTSFKMCINIFSKLMYSIGSKELKKLYLEVAEKLNSPAAKLVTFSINSYYGTITPKELHDLAKEFKGNIVALRILKFRVRTYVYNRNLDYSTKQKLASCLDMTLGSNTNAERNSGDNDNRVTRSINKP
jgi:Calcineurin-like phosphoesterase